MENLIKLIESFETQEAKIYWIDKLSVSDTIKGRLLIHFNL